MKDMKGMIFACFMVGALALGAQQTQQGQQIDPAGGSRAAPLQRDLPTFRATTTLVQVDVVVVDAAGKPVRGLTKDDFTVLDGGIKRPIAGFLEYSREDSFSLPVFPASFKLDVADNAAARSDRVVVMVLDDLNGFSGRDARVKDLASTIVSDLGPHAVMALFTTTGKQRAELTADRSKLLALIDTFAGDKKVRKPYLATAPRAGAAAQPDSVGQADRDNQSPWLSASSGAGAHIGEYYSTQAMYAAMEGASRVLMADQGRRKAFVYISEGTMSPPTLAMMTALRRAGVAIYAIDPRGFVAHHSDDMFIECSGDDACFGKFITDLSWVEMVQQSLTRLADQTGGVAIVNTNDFAGGVRRVVDDLENYYVIGFSPADRRKPGYVPVTVQIAKPGLTLRYRRGYQLAPDAGEREPANPLVALSAGALPKSELPLQAYAVPMPAGKDARVAFWLEVRGDALPMLESDGSLHDTLRYAVIPVDVAHGKTLNGLSKVAQVLLRPRSKVKAEWPSRVIYQVDATLPAKAGSYQFRLSATSTRLQKSGSVYLTVDVPDFSKAPLALGGIVLGYDGPPRVPVADTAAANAKLPFQATLDRVFGQQDVLRLICDVARQNGKASESAAPTPTVELVNESGAVVRTFIASIAAQPAGRIEARLSLAEVPVGPYRLRVQVADGRNTARQEVAIIAR